MNNIAGIPVRKGFHYDVEAFFVEKQPLSHPA